MEAAALRLSNKSLEVWGGIVLMLSEEILEILFFYRKFQAKPWVIL